MPTIVTDFQTRCRGSGPDPAAQDRGRWHRWAHGDGEIAITAYATQIITAPGDIDRPTC
jgi:hypothetical protein